MLNTDVRADQHNHAPSARTGLATTALAATGLAVVGLASTYLLPGLLGNGHTFDVRGFVTGLAVTVVLAAVLFWKVLPSAVGAAPKANRPATVGLVTSIFAFVGIALFWLGVPFVVAGAGFALGRVGQQRPVRRGWAKAAVAISAVVVVLTLALLVNDVLGHVGLGFQPPE